MVEKQGKFTKTVAKFIGLATDMGYLFTFGEALRTPEMALIYAKRNSGIKKSLHIDKLAIDLNAFFNGKYLDASEAWHITHLDKLGELWESLDPLCAWGGRFRPRIDYNHYSFEHNGVK